MVGKTGGCPGRALLDHVPDMVTISDREGRIVYANPATERLSGYAPEEFVSLNPFAQIHPEDRPRCKEAFRELLRNPGLSLQIEHRVRRKDGAWRWVQGTFASLFDDPEVGRLLATARDVTEGKRAEEALRESDERQAFLLELSDALRPLGDPLEVQETAARLLGEELGAGRIMYVEVLEADGAGETPPVIGRFSAADFGPSLVQEGRGGHTMIVDDIGSEPRLAPNERDAFLAMGIHAYITTPLIKEGRWVASLTVHHVSPRDWTRREIALVEEVADRTWAAVERARAERELRVSEEKYRTLFESMDESFCIVEMIFDSSGVPVDYRFVEMNPAFERHTGLRDAVGQRMRELEPRQEEHWFEIYGRIVRTGRPERLTNVAEYLEGRWFDVYAFRVGVPEERKVAILFADITAGRPRRSASGSELWRLRPGPRLRSARGSAASSTTGSPTPWVSRTRASNFMRPTLRATRRAPPRS